MTRSRDFSKILGRSVTNDTFSATGSITPLSVTSYDYDSAGQLQALNNSSLVDGSLHYLSKTKQLYVWDDSDNSYYPIDQGTSALEGAPSYLFQGSVSGYTSGGDPFGPLNTTIDKFPFASDGNATDVGDLTGATVRTMAGQSSADNGYVSGGNAGSAPQVDVIEKFSFSVDGNATDVGDLTSARKGSAGQSSSASGYTSGGYSPTSTNLNIIDKFPFSTDANAADVGDLTQARKYTAGQSSSVSGYTSGGIAGTPQLNVIDKFPFSSDANATDVGDITTARSYLAGQSSTDNGYNSGGNVYTNIIDKYSFTSDGNATDVGDLTSNKRFVTGQSSTASGYTSGGQQPPPGINFLDVIDKFPFSADGNATDVGDLTVGRRQTAGQQV